MDLGPKMMACTEREQRFVIEYLSNGCEDASEAARQAGYTDPGPHSASIRVSAHRALQRPRVVEAMQEVARTHFGGLLLPAVAAAERMISNPRHPDHAKMVLAVLSAQGLGERNKVDVNFSGEVSLNRTDEALSHLRMLKSLDVPRAKLEEIFGFSGLERYEKMLASKPEPKVIEGEVVDRG